MLLRMSSRLAALFARPLGWWRRLSSQGQDRLVGLTLALPTGLVLAIARWLTPAIEGVGTHKQLGLGGCTVLTLTGYPCPMCGMTTTFTHLAHLEPLAALATQPFGVVLFSATVVIFSIATADLIAPAGRWRRAMGWLERREGWMAGGLLAGLALGWIYKLSVMQGWLTIAV